MIFKIKEVMPPKPVGEELQNRRKKLKLGLGEVEKKTKIKKSHLSAIEDSQWNNLPSEVYVIGFLKTYAKALKLNGRTGDITKRFKKEHRAYREVNESKEAEKPKEVEMRRFSFTPKIIFALLASIVILLVGGYFWFQVAGFAASPDLQILEPTGMEMRTNEEKINIKGKTDIDVSVDLNSEPIPVDASGNFSQKISLQKGVNVIEVAATNSAGKTTTKVVQVMVE